MIFSSIPVDALSVICQNVGIGVQHKPPYISMTHWEGPDWTYARQTSWQAIQSGEDYSPSILLDASMPCFVVDAPPSWCKTRAGL
jgi:hypothetical protein